MLGHKENKILEKKYGPLATKARNAMEEEFKKGQRSKTQNSDAKILLNDGKVIESDCNICYAPFNSKRGDAKKYVAIIASVQKLIVDEQIARRYFEWLLHYSPYQEVFVTKRGKTAIDHGVFVADADKPSNLLFGGLTAGRMVSEYARIPNMWNGLVGAGVHPNLAFVYSHYLVQIGDKMKIEGLGTGHTAIDGVASENSYYARFTDEVPINFQLNIRIDKPSYRQTGRFSGINATWKKENPLAKKMVVISKLQNVLKDACAEKSKSANVFKKDVNVAHPDYNVGLEAVAAFFKEQYKEIL